MVLAWPRPRRSAAASKNGNHRRIHALARDLGFSPAFLMTAFAVGSGWPMALFMTVLAAGSGCLATPSPSGCDAPITPRGCTVDGGAPPPTTPLRGYYTNGATVCAIDGTPHTFVGVDRPSLEWSSGGDHVSPADFQMMASWGANVVRIALNQDFWLSGANLHDPSYRSTVDGAVKWAEAAGLDVILDLHWSDAGDLTVTSTASQGPASSGQSGQQQMADVNSIQFWKEVADAYKGDGRVLFELYNEPHGIGWDAWLNGGSAGKYAAAGMQQLYDAVRGTGANNVVIAGGLNWAYDLSGVGACAASIHGYNVMYATHPYLKSGDAPSGWEGSFGHLETTDFAPVIATEFGDSRSGCTGDYDQEIIAFAKDHHTMSWTAWAWYPSMSAADPQGCAFPSLILDWSGTPSVQGVVVKAALQAYGGSMSPVPADAGGGLADGLLEGPDEDASAHAGASFPDVATVDAARGEAGFDAPGDAPGEGSDDASDAGAFE
jgi:endoglucanase